MVSYSLNFSKTVERTLKKLTRGDLRLKKAVKKGVDVLVKDPFHPSLRTHKVRSRRFGVKWSSYISGDIRLIWDFSPMERGVIRLWDIGGHSGKRSVYK